MSYGALINTAEEQQSWSVEGFVSDRRRGTGCCRLLLKIMYPPPPPRPPVPSIAGVSCVVTEALARSAD